MSINKCDYCQQDKHPCHDSHCVCGIVHDKGQDQRYHTGDHHEDRTETVALSPGSIIVLSPAASESDQGVSACLGHDISENDKQYAHHHTGDPA